jgi:hypothetical protein
LVAEYQKQIRVTSSAGFEKKNGYFRTAPPTASTFIFLKKPPVQFHLGRPFHEVLTFNRNLRIVSNKFDMFRPGAYLKELEAAHSPGTAP